MESILAGFLVCFSPVFTGVLYRKFVIYFIFIFCQIACVWLAAYAQDGAQRGRV
jgi:hypothetical protein